MEQKVIDVLRGIGLGKSEIDVYFDLLQKKVSTVSEIAKKTKQHRANVYEALERLEEKGLISEIVEKNKRYFKAKAPDTIFNYVEQKGTEVKEILPFLEQISKKVNEPESISVSYGLSRMRMVLQEAMNMNTDLVIWDIPANISEILGQFFIEGLFIKQKSKVKKRRRFLYNENPEYLKKIPLLTNNEIKYLSKKDTGAMVVHYDESVFFFVFNSEPLIIEMKGKIISEWFMSQFETLWDIAKKA